MKLSQIVSTYVTYKQSLGMRFTTEARTLKSFCCAMGDIDADQITSDQVHCFLAGTGPVTRFWERKLSALRGFYCFALARGYIRNDPLPLHMPKVTKSFVPYIYSQGDMKRLLDATALRERGNFPPLLCRTLLLLLYATGLRIGEALALDLSDVDLDRRILHIRNSKFYKTRLVPIGADLASVLADYLNERIRQSPLGPNAPFLMTPRGKRPSRTGAEYAFVQLREHAQVRREQNARYQPRLQDLRHSFAVTRLITWYREGKDVQRLLPQLATYLGHVNIAATQSYLTMTPELLRQASLRFEAYVQGGSGHA